MSYLNISEAAWSLVLSKDPRTKPAPKPPGSAGNLNNSISDHHDTHPTMRPSAVGQAQQEAGNTTSSRRTTAGALQSQQLQQGGSDVVEPATARQTADALPLDLLTGVRQANKDATAAATAWSPCSGEPPGAWLTATHGPRWQAECASAAREASAAHKQLMGQLEQRRAALLKDIGRARDLDLKVLLQMVATYTDDTEALLSSSQAAALKAQQDYTNQSTATAAAAVAGSIEAALEAAHRKHQEQMAHVQQEHKAQMDSFRVGAKQQLNAALQLHQQQAQEQLDRQVKELDSTGSWAARCKDAEAAAAKQEALRAYADSECAKLRTELAAAKREAANWRSRWEKESSTTGGTESSAGIGSLSKATSVTAGGVPVAFDLLSSAGAASSRPSIQSSRPPSRRI